VPASTWRVPHKESRPHPNADRRADNHAEAPFHEREADLGAHACAGAIRKAIARVILASERLHDPKRFQRLLDDGQGRALEPLRVVPLTAKTPPVETHREEENRDDGERDEGKLPIDPCGDIDHAGDGHGRSEERDEAGDGDVLDSGGVVLDPVRGVCRAARIVIREREALRVAEQPAAELEKKLLAGGGGQHQPAEFLHLFEQRDEDEESRRDQQDTRLRLTNPRRHDGGDESGQRLRADDAVDGDRDRKRRQQREHTREQTEREESADLSPVGPGVEHQPPVELQSGVRAAGPVHINAHLDSFLQSEHEEGQPVKGVEPSKIEWYESQAERS
jgi:hypothetical protein